MVERDRRASPYLEDLYFGECPRWHHGRLWYSDFFDGAVWSATPGGNARRELEVDGEPAGLGWLPDGRLLVVSRLRRAVLRREDDGTLVTHGTLAPWAGYHGNDMVVSARGQAYVGNFGFDLDGVLSGPDPGSLFSEGGAPSTSLVRIDPNGTAQEAAGGMVFPNGSVLTPDGGTLVVAETLAGRLTAFDVATNGVLSGRRVWATLDATAPDGICLDTEGAIWVANALAPECLRVIEGGEVVDRVTTTDPCYACMLAGDDRQTLYVVTAPTSLAHEARRRRLGQIRQIRVAIPGAGFP